MIDFGTEGGIDALLARSNELDVVHIRVIERATNKVVVDTALVKGQKIKELVVDGKTFCKLSYNNVYVSKMVFDLVTLSMKECPIKNGCPMGFSIEMAKPNPQKYIIELGLADREKPYFVSIK